MASRFDRILIFNSAFPGDIVLTTPLVRAASRAFPGAYLAFCTTAAGAGLLEGLPHLGRLIIYDKHGRDRGILGLVKTAARLRSERFDLVLSAHRSARTSILLALAGIPVRVGWDRSALRWFYTHLVARKPGDHETRRNLRLLEPLGIQVDSLDHRPMLPVTAEEASLVSGRLGVGRLQGAGPLVLVAPGSVWATKRWLAGRFAELIDMLTETLSAKVVLIGSPQDREQADKVVAGCTSQVLDLIGKTDLREAAALVRGARLLVTGDSAPMHIAWAMDLPTVAIFGATTPELGFAPLSEKCKVVQVKNLDCRPCGEHGPSRCKPGHFRCMREITAAMVMDACREILGRHSGS